MTYHRVIPRDLFNEGSLLKCYGRLALMLDCRDGRAKLAEGDGGPFEVVQDAASGAITVASLPFTIDGKPVHLSRPLNSREPWPLYAEPSLDGEWFDPVAVFDDDGNLTDEFERLIGALEPIQ